MTHNISLGKQGENIAVNYLIQQGYKILERNFRHTYGEIDIIALCLDILIFVEVKTRRNIKFGYPQEAINKNKINHIKKTSLAFIEEYHPSFQEIRFDVIAILYQKGKWKLNHIKAAF